MDIYSVVPLPQLKVSFTDIFNNKAEYSASGANKFLLAFNKALKNLEVFPQSGSNLFVGYKTKIVNGCVLAYRIDEVQKKVYVFDIVDPTRDTLARKYFD